MRVTRETGLCVSWKLTYPGYHPRGSRPLAQGCGRAEPGWGWWGVSMKLFFCPQLRGHLQLMGPSGAGGSVSQPPSLPPVSPEAKKRGSATRTSSWVRVLASPGGSFGRAGGGAGHRRTSPPTCFQQNKKAWPSPAPFPRWPRSRRVGRGLELGERVRIPAVLTHCLFLYRTSSLRLTS